MKYLYHLAELHENYDAFFCDVWGVLHNGVQVFDKAQTALIAARETGKYVILITNSPRPKETVTKQLEKLGVNQECYDAIVTSGDVTRDLIAANSRKIFWIGPERDAPLFDGLDVEFVEEYEAQVVVVTGLFDDRRETPEDYREILARLRTRNLPLICANPDLVVDHGGVRLWCAGALARDYALLGGRTLVAGKPHRLIYQAACREIAKLGNNNIEKSRIMAIGDGLLTDIKGADSYGIDALYIGEGIHRNEYRQGEEVNQERLKAFFDTHGLHPTAFMMGLA